MSLESEILEMVLKKLNCMEEKIDMIAKKIGDTGKNMQKEEKATIEQYLEDLD